MVSSLKDASGRIEKTLTGSRFRYNTFLLVRANVVTQALLLLATPILTRLFSPDEFGAAGLFLVGAALFGACASFRFEWSIPSAHGDKDAQSLAALSIALSAVVALLLFCAFLIIDQGVLFGFVGMQPIPFSLLLPPLAFATSVVAILSAVYVRMRSLEKVSHSKYIQSGTLLAGNLATGLLGLGAFGLILSYTLAVCAGAVSLLYKVPFQLALGPKALRRLAAVARRYAAQASASTAVSLVNFTFANCMPLLLLWGYSVREVGFYFVAMRLAGAPAALISSGISSSFWGEAANLAKRDPLGLRRMYLKVVRGLFLMSLPVAAGCLAAPFFLPVLLGADDWGEIGLMVVACLPQIVATLVFSSTNHLIVYDRQVFQLISDLLSIAGSLAALWIAKSLDWPFWAAVLAISSVILCSYLLRFFLHLKANDEAVRAHVQL